MEEIMLKSHLLITLSITIGVTSSAVAYDNKFVHLLINKSGAMQSQQLLSTLPKIGFANGIDEPLKEKVIWKWFQEGGLKEDEPFTRTFNHFHDPTRSWDDAGLKGSWVGCSSILWAQNNCSSANDKWSWAKAREYFYTALTTDSTTPDSTTIREQNYADTFRALGQQMHLLSDAAVPEHTRNDIHVFPLLDTPDQSFPQIGSGTYETWCKHNRDNLNTTATAMDYSITNNSLVSGLAPTSNFWDTTPSAGTTTTPVGLAEYTNFNFVSGDTIFKDFEYPQQPISFIVTAVVAKDGKTDDRVYFRGTTSDGKSLNHLASTGYLWSELSQVSAFDIDDSRYVLDDECFKDYAAILVPKAISYSAGMLDYFFRGKIDISVPANGLYSMIPGTATGFTTIKLRAKNGSAAGEEMTDGDIKLVVKYKVAQEDPFKSGPVPTTPDFSYIVAPEKDNIRTISRSYTDFNFDLNLPLYATDISLQVVYKGRLGNEDGAIAVGFKDISEPTPIDMFNNMDKICINGSWFDAGSPNAIAQVDANHDGIAGTDEADVYAYDLANIYLRFSPYSTTAPYYYASPNVYDFTIPSLAKGNHVRAVYLLSDYVFNKGYYLSYVNLEPTDPWIRSDLSRLWWHSAVKRQREYSEDSALCDGNPPCYVDIYPELRDTYSPEYYPGFYTFRNATMWWGSVKLLINNPYPTGSECSYDLL
jgi:hypothetical protein